MLKEFLSCEVQPPNIMKVQDSTCTLLHNLQEKKKKKKGCFYLFMVSTEYEGKRCQEYM